MAPYWDGRKIERYLKDIVIAHNHDGDGIGGVSTLWIDDPVHPVRKVAFKFDQQAPVIKLNAQ